MEVLRKIQNQPKRTRKIILWTTVIIIGLALMVFWVGNVQQKLKSFEMKEFKKELNFPSFGKELKNLPK